MPGTRIRSLKPEFLTSPSSAKVSPQARLLYLALWCLANDYGYGETNLLVILGHAFPVSDGVTVEQLQQMLIEVADGYGTMFYEVRGRHYYQIPTWSKHNRRPNSRSRQWYPTPDDPDSTPDLRFYPRVEVFPESSGNKRENSGGSCGTGERGSCGTGERGNGGTGELVGDHRAGALDRMGRPAMRLDTILGVANTPLGPPPDRHIPPEASELILRVVPKSQPRKVREKLRVEVGDLFNDGTDPAHIEVAVDRYLTRLAAGEDLYPGNLKYIVGQVVAEKTLTPEQRRNGRAPTRKETKLAALDALRDNPRLAPQPTRRELPQ